MREDKKIQTGNSPSGKKEFQEKQVKEYSFNTGNYAGYDFDDSYVWRRHQYDGKYESGEFAYKGN